MTFIKNGLILAAGLSSRMGDFKPLLKLHQKTLIETTIDSMFNSEIQDIVVVLGYRANEVELLLRKRYSPVHLQFAYNLDYANTDMVYSTQKGLQIMKDCDAFYFLPGDMPVVSRDTFQAIAKTMECTKAKITFPTIDGYRKHPPLISKQCIPDILAFNKKGGLRVLWEDYKDDIATVAVNDLGCTIDTDTKTDYFYCVHYMNQLKNNRMQSIRGEVVL